MSETSETTTADDELDVAGEAITLEPAPVEDAGPDERIVALEGCIDDMGLELDERRKEIARLEQRIAHLEALTRDATINADVVSLQGKVAGLEDQVGARQAVAIAELATRVDALEART